MHGGLEMTGKIRIETKEIREKLRSGHSLYVQILGPILVKIRQGKVKSSLCY